MPNKMHLFINIQCNRIFISVPSAISHKICTETYRHTYTANYSLADSHMLWAKPNIANTENLLPIFIIIAILVIDVSSVIAVILIHSELAMWCRWIRLNERNSSALWRHSIVISAFWWIIFSSRQVACVQRPYTVCSRSLHHTERNNNKLKFAYL